jgi:Domain of unknown function (DUF5076)
MPIESYAQIELPAELTTQSGLEILRAGIVGHDLQIVLKRCFDNPADWGAAAAEILQYAAKIYEAESDITAEDALAHMVEMFMAMISKPVTGEAIAFPRDN